MSISHTGVIATDTDLKWKEGQDRYFCRESGDVALHPRENDELDAAIRRRESGRRVVGITAADLDAMEFPPINWIVSGRSAASRLARGSTGLEAA